MENKQFGRLLVLSKHSIQNEKQMWFCLCDCGKTTIVSTGDLNSKHTKSCGCFRIETTVSRSYKHGEIYTRLYKRWGTMRYRCSAKSSDRRYYYDRGITVCPRWNSFENFKIDMGDTFETKLTLERVDNNSGYSPENCRWATRAEQSKNRTFR